MSKLVCAVLSLTACLRLGAEVIDLNGEPHTLDPATELSAEFTNSSDTLATLTIEAAEALTFAGSISGNIKLVKTGSAQLDVSTVNDFTGGVDLNAGVLNFTVAGSLGDGTITIASGATLLLGAAVECANPIHLMASTSNVKFAVNSANAKFSGAITGESGITFTPTSPKGVLCSFTGDITIPNGSLKIAQKTQESYLSFYGRVSVKTVVVSNTGGQVTSMKFFSDQNEWTSFSFWRYNAQSAAPVFAEGSIPKESFVSCSGRAAGNNVNFNITGNQEFHYFCSSSASCPAHINATAASTVTLGSEVENTGVAQKTTAYVLGGQLTLVYSPRNDDSTWSIESGASTMTGSLTVQKGIMSVGGTATFANVPKIVVAAGAAFSCTSTGTTPLKSLKQLDLGTDSAFTLGGGIEVVLDSYSVDGKVAAVPEGWYTGVDNPNPKSGDKQTITMLKGTGRIYIPYQGSSSEAIWNGGAGDDTSVRTDANWEGGSVPNLEGGLTATFATGGSTATFPDAVTLEKIVLNRATGFTLAAGSDAASVSLASGMEIAAPMDDTPVTNVVSVPVNLSAVQTWLTPAKTVLELRAPISSEGPTAFDLSGAGTYAYYGTNTFTGSLYLTNGVHRVYTDTGAFGAANPGNTVDFRSSLGASLWLGGTKIEKNFNLTKPSGNNAGGMSFAAGTTNEFAGYFSAGANWTPGGSSRIVFSGGGTISSYFRPDVGGTYVFTGKPMSIGTGYMLKSTHIFQVASNAVTDITMNQSTDLWLLVPNAFKNRPDLTQDAATGADNDAIVHLDGNDQEFGHLKLNNQYGWFETPKDKPARLSFKQTSNTALRTTAFRGPISLEILGTGANAVSITDAVSATGGDLSIKDVTLAIGGSGSFASVTNVSASGASTILSVAHGQPFARRANLALDGGAKVDVPAGVVLRVGELRVNGELLCGEFTSETHPDIVSGEGKVRTSGMGMILFVR